MEKFDINQPASFMITVFKFAGAWQNKKSAFWLRYIYAPAIQIPFYVSFVLFMCINLAFISDIEAITESLYMTLTEVAMLVKFYNVVQKHDRLQGLLKKMQSPLLMPRNLQERSFYKKPHKRFNIQRTIFVLICISCIVSGYIGAAASKEYKLPFPIWLPFDWKSSRLNYWIAFSYEVMSMNLTAMTNASLDLLQAYLLFQISLFYRLLSNRMETIGHVDPHTVAKEEKSSIAKLLECIQTHQYVTSMAKDAEEFITVPLFFQINVSAIVLCFTAFQMTLLSPLKDPGTFFLYFYFMGAMFIEILMPCFYGNEVIMESNLVSTGIYNSNWTELPMQYRRIMYHFMERLKKPTVLIAGGYFHISLRSLMSVMQSAYSLFALIINLEK